MRIEPILQTWVRTLRGQRSALSIEITRECPLRCPGCYAYEDGHLGGPNLRSLADFKGEELISNVLALVDQHKPLHLSIVGGDPLVRYRELDILLPELARRDIHVQVVTSAFRPIAPSWASLPIYGSAFRSTDYSRSTMSGVNPRPMTRSGETSRASTSRFIARSPARCSSARDIFETL